MHPSISLFPNNEFYEGDIINAPKVKEAIYSRRFLHGNMYGPFSFINVASTVPELEEFNVRHSSKNMVEVAVVSQIIASLFEGMVLLSYTDCMLWTISEMGNSVFLQLISILYRNESQKGES